MNPLPPLQILQHLGKQRNGANGILGLGCLDHNLCGCLLRILGFLGLVQTVQGAAYVNPPSMHVHVLPAQPQQFSQADAGKQNQPNKNTVTVLIAALDQAHLLVTGQDGNLRSAAAGQIHRGGRVAVDIALGFRFVVVKQLEHPWRQLLQHHVPQRRFQMHPDIAFIA